MANHAPLNVRPFLSGSLVILEGVIFCSTVFVPSLGLAKRLVPDRWYRLFRQALGWRHDDDGTGDFAQNTVCGGADEQVVDGVVSMRAHHDVGRVQFFRSIKYFKDGGAADELRLDREIRVAETQGVADLRETSGGVFFADRYGLLKVFRGETIIAREHGWLDNVEQDNSAVGGTGEGAGGFDDTGRGG